MITINRKILFWMIVIPGWADIAITLIGQIGISGIREDDPIGRILLICGPLVFGIIGFLFWMIVGLSALYIPKYLAMILALTAFGSGAVALTFWAAILIGDGIETISTFITVGMIGCIALGIGWNLFQSKLFMGRS